MKTKLLLILSFAAAATSAAAQIDSTAIQNVLQTGAQIATAIRPEQWVNGIPNSAITAIVTILAGVVIRFFEKRKMKRNKN